MCHAWDRYSCGDPGCYDRADCAGETEADERTTPPATRLPIPFGAALALAVSFAVTLFVGFLPSSLADTSRDAVPTVTGPEKLPPEGLMIGVAAGAPFTVSVAAALVAELTPFVTTTRYCVPLIAVVVDGVV